MPANGVIPLNAPFVTYTDANGQVIYNFVWFLVLKEVALRGKWTILNHYLSSNKSRFLTIYQSVRTLAVTCARESTASLFTWWIVNVLSANISTPYTRSKIYFFNAILAKKLEIHEHRVAVCRDHINGICRRQQCKYYHIPIQLPPATEMSMSLYGC